MKDTEHKGRDFASISPSANALLKMKARTNIPYARQAAALIEPSAEELVATEEDAHYWGRLVHFEQRYMSIDQLLSDIPAKNIVELSSGFSFRGLAAVRNQDICYMDTDLPGVIDVKKRLVAQLCKQEPKPKGTLEILPLNALDEAGLRTVIEQFASATPVVFVNEGLLMYLEESEKIRLCQSIYKILLERGGYWITADIYLKRLPASQEHIEGDKLQAFFEAHRIQEKMFTSFEAANAFFSAQGFVIDRKASVKPSQLSALPKLQEAVGPEALAQMKDMPAFQETWRLKIRR